MEYLLIVVNEVWERRKNILVIWGSSSRWDFGGNGKDDK